MRILPDGNKRNHCGSLLLATAAILGGPYSTWSQTIRVDTAAAHAIPFDPDEALGTSIDILPTELVDTVYSDAILKESRSAGWGPITYRQNTELTISGWHWNPDGKWSDAAHKSGYFTGSVETRGVIRQSFGYDLPHRGSMHGDASAGQFSRLTDGDPASYWKSNPYLTKQFTGEDDALLPQWIVLEFPSDVDIDAIEIQWANPYARNYAVEYWIGEDALNKQAAGTWTKFPHGGIQDAKGGRALIRLADSPIETRFVRILMMESSNTCDSHGSSDVRNCVGYAVAEISLGNFTTDGKFIDVVKHARGQNQTATRVSSTDPWHSIDNIVPSRAQSGFDLFFTSGITNNLPAMIPIAMVYANPEDAAAELAYLEARKYRISYVEMGEEPDGEFMLPEDYAALYLQFARALHRVDAKLKLGGPVFTGANQDIKSWPDAQGRTSWMERFVGYLKAHGRLNDLAFVSFEHYPFAPCDITWADLYREPELVRHILQVWREDGVPENIPLMITESNVSWALTQPMADVFAALWLADNTGSFLASGGAAFYHSPIQPEPLRRGCGGYSTYGNFVANEKLEVRQHTSQYFASQLINLEWVRHGAGKHQLFPTEVDIKDDAGHELITSYAVRRPDGEWSLMVVNRDPSNAHSVKIEFAGERGEPSAKFSGEVAMVSFGAEQYVWHPDGANSHADPDGPLSRKILKGGQDIVLPKASVSVLRGKVSEK